MSVVKVCGITRLADARHAAAAGATALGFVFWRESPRYIEPAQAADIIADLPADVAPVGVFVNARADEIRDTVAAAGLAVVQLHGDETPAVAAGLAPTIWRATAADASAADLDAWPSGTVFVVDTADRVRRGGTGRLVDWARARSVAASRSVVLAGGLTPENVADAIEAVRPFGVDVSSGVEQAPGLKDPDKVARFVANARRAFGESARG